MIKPKARWQVAEIDEQKAQMLAKELNVSPYVAKLLLNRGIDTVEKARQFLFIDETDYYDPFLLSDMEKAVTRIKAAITSGERILIYGDYDADGVSSTTVMIYTFEKLGANFSYYIPNRFTEGYGPNEAAFRSAKEEGFSLIVTVDTGISAVHEAEVAKELAIDLIITDHHEAPPILPDAYAIINPKKPGCTYPFKGLAGVGVAFKVAHALLGYAPKDLLDIVAIGTVADLVPLMDENRLIVKEGIQALQMSTKPGIIALKKVCGINHDKVTTDHIGFAIGPRINAAGRLDSADPAVNLLITDNVEEAEMLVDELESLNRERQSLVTAITKEAILQVEENYLSSDNKVLVVGGEGWNPGVIGIVASRIVERYYRPTIVLSYDGQAGLAKGSARSIEGFDMFAHLSQNRELLPHFGGHPMAAGLTMNLADVDELRRRLNKQAAEVLTDEDYIPIEKIDFIVKIEDITVDLIQQMDRLAPYGVDNPAPKFMLKDVEIEQMRKIGSDENHLKISFADNDSILDCVGFHKGYLYEELTPIAKVSAIGKLAINEWNNHMKPQLFLEDVSVSEWQLYDWRSMQQKISEQIDQLPENKRLIICFNKETVTSLKLENFEEEIWHVHDLSTHSASIEQSYVILLDLPEKMEQMKALFQNMRQVERIYLIFYQRQNYFFSSQPNREQFKRYYAFLFKRKTFDVRSHGKQLAEHFKWAKDSVDFMTKVFLELDFVTMKDGMIEINPNPEKKDLMTSPTYQKHFELINIEKTFLYSSYNELKQWFDNLINNYVKETV